MSGDAVDGRDSRDKVSVKEKKSLSLSPQKLTKPGDPSKTLLKTLIFLPHAFISSLN